VVNGTGKYSSDRTASFYSASIKAKTVYANKLLSFKPCEKLLTAAEEKHFKSFKASEH